MKSLRKKCKDNPETSVEALASMQETVAKLSEQYRRMLQAESTLENALSARINHLKEAVI